MRCVSKNGKGYDEDMDEGGLDIRGAAIFSKRLPWVKKVHSAYLKVWAPLPDGKVHELTFECKALEPMPKHSGIVTK
jgi:hypothetical protein